MRELVALHYCLHQETDPSSEPTCQPLARWTPRERDAATRWQPRGEEHGPPQFKLLEDFFMSKILNPSSASCNARLHRREFLCITPSAVVASFIPLESPAATLTQSGQHRGGLAALWDHSGDGSGSIIKPSTVERLDGLFSGCNVGLISASRSEFTMDVNQGRGARPSGLHLAPLRLHRRRCPLQRVWSPSNPNIDGAMLPPSQRKEFRQWQSQRVLTPVWSNPRSRARSL